MEKSTLYQQKVTLLSRLVKENAVTFEEALLLLKNDDLEKQDPPKSEGVIPTRFKATDFTQSYQSTMPIIFSTPTVDADGYRLHIPSGTMSISNDSIFTINSAADLNT